MTSGSERERKGRPRPDVGWGGRLKNADAEPGISEGGTCKCDGENTSGSRERAIRTEVSDKGLPGHPRDVTEESVLLSGGTASQAEGTEVPRLGG